MNIIHIFADKLYAIRFAHESEDEWNKLNKQWTDLIWLEDFFEANKTDLSGLTVEEAVIQTMNEADLLFDTILSKVNEKGWLNSVFKNLHNQEYKTVVLSKKKAKRNWLRIYAIKIDADVFLITGGAIKLTHLMQDRVHTKVELIKLEQAKNYLKENDVFDEDSFREFELEL